jgi:hypothetical protein
VSRRWSALPVNMLITQVARVENIVYLISFSTRSLTPKVPAKAEDYLEEALRINESMVLQIGFMAPIQGPGT